MLMKDMNKCGRKWVVTWSHKKTEVVKMLKKMERHEKYVTENEKLQKNMEENGQ